MRPVVAALLVVTVAVGATACGDKAAKEANAYVASVNSAQSAFAARLDRLSRNFTATSTPEQDQRTLGSFKAAVDQAVMRLRAIDPPDRVSALHRRLVATIAAYGDDISRAQRGFGSSDASTRLKAQTELRTAITETGDRVNSTIEQINQKLRS
jgi:hypothetical protein